MKKLRPHLVRFGVVERFFRRHIVPVGAYSKTSGLLGIKEWRVDPCAALSGHQFPLLWKNLTTTMSKLGCHVAQLVLHCPRANGLFAKEVEIRAAALRTIRPQRQAHLLDGGSDPAKVKVRVDVNVDSAKQCGAVVTRGNDADAVF